MNKIELYYQWARDRAVEQVGTNRHFQTLATVVLSVAGALVGIMALGSHRNGYAVGVIVFFALTAIASLAVLWPGKWLFNPQLKDLQKHVTSAEYEDQALVEWTADAITVASVENDKMLLLRAWLMRVAYGTLVIEGLLLGLALLKA